MNDLFPSFGDVIAAIALALFVGGMLYVYVRVIREEQQREEGARRATPPPRPRPSTSVRVLRHDDDS